MYVNISKAKNSISKLIHLLEIGQEKEIIICKRGTPIMRWIPIANTLSFGILKGQYPKSDPNLFFALDEEIAREFEGE